MVRHALALAALLLLGGTAARAAEVCAGLPARQPLPREARPEPLGDQSWLLRVTELERLALGGEAQPAQMLFLGDSLVQAWAPLVFEHFYGDRQAVNFGAGGDTTQSLLWRLSRLPLGSGLKPRLAVVLVGTNNTAAGSRPEDTALGIAEVVRTIRRRSPQTRVLLVGLLPRGGLASEPMRAVNDRVNALVAGCADGQTVFYTAPGSMVVDRAGRLSDQVAYDHLHLTWLGYGILSAALEPQIRRLLWH
ncbi:GDSL-type esterase/lipase family protein [Dankookia sp. GCM10030260]|uniref:GDSL-type esterase/lipase family protein n=1 Tax=Dankookia sp. GCM10030260 TaxID=3273390 RepID=UPI0036241988